MKKKGEITQKEAVKKALEMLGGMAHLKQIYPVAIKLIGDNTKSKDIRATIRRELNSSPFVFKPIPSKEGWWMLISYQEKLAEKDKKICDLEVLLQAKEAELKSIKTEDGFISRLIEKIGTIWKDDKKTIAEIRKILAALGRSDMVAVLDASLNPSKKQKKQSEKMPSKIVINGDYVNTKHVDNEVNNVESGATGVNINKEDEEDE